MDKIFWRITVGKYEIVDNGKEALNMDQRNITEEELKVVFQKLKNWKVLELNNIKS